MLCERLRSSVVVEARSSRKVVTAGGVDEGDHRRSSAGRLSVLFTSAVLFIAGNRNRNHSNRNGTDILKMNSFQFSEVEVFQLSECEVGAQTVVPAAE